jgi:putative endonuclease
MYYVYILRSEKDGSRYIGVTEDLKRRLAEHNSGSNKYSSTKLPIHIIWYSAFPQKQQAYNFERYLKSGSGSAFMNKRLVKP